MAPNSASKPRNSHSNGRKTEIHQCAEGARQGVADAGADAGLVVIDAGAIVAPHDAGEQPDHQHHQWRDAERDGAARPVLQRADGLFVGEDGVEAGRAAGAAAGHQEDQAELVEGRNEAQQHDDDDDVAQARQGDVAEALQRIGAIDLGRLELFAVDGLEAGQQQQGIKRDSLPDVDGNDAGQSELGIGEPTHRLVDDAEAHAGSD